MFYDFAFSIPAGTTQAAPKVERLKLTHGIIHTFRIYFPPGPRGEVNLVVLNEAAQLYPTNRGGSFNADNLYVSFDDYFELTRAPFELVAKGWSPDADYNHTLRIEVGVLESRIALASLRLARGLEKMLSILGVRV